MEGGQSLIIVEMLRVLLGDMCDWEVFLARCSHDSKGSKGSDDFVRRLKVREEVTNHSNLNRRPPSWLFFSWSCLKHTYLCILLGTSTSSHTPGCPVAEHDEESEAVVTQRLHTGYLNPSSLDPAPLTLSC